MAQILLGVFFVLLFSHVTTASELICRTEEPCPVSYKTLGCYKDYEDNRVLPNYIYNERDPTNANYGGRSIEWYNWDTYMAGFSCRCAKKAKELGYDLFGVQFYGECWAGHSSIHSSNLVTTDAKCIGDNYSPCGHSNRYCAGEHYSNFVYKIVNITCEIEFVREGCFKDHHNDNARPLTNYVLNDRDASTGSFSGRIIDWRNWDVYIPEFACRCAKAAQNNGSTYFGLQFYGECWTHPLGNETYGRDGSSADCVNNCFKSCKRHPFCSGVQKSNYVYRIKGKQTCDINLESIGCYTENPAGRVLSEELVNSNYPPSDKFYGVMADPENWDAFFPEFLCKCAQETRIKGYLYFAVSDNGRCYSDMVSENYAYLGASSSCYEGKPNRACAAGSMACAGINPTANYVYKLVTP